MNETKHQNGKIKYDKIQQNGTDTANHHKTSSWSTWHGEYIIKQMHQISHLPWMLRDRFFLKI